jgi:hypothetical protein
MRRARVYTTGMFVRWQKYRNKPATTAILVEGVRVDGKPRQRHLAYLGSFRREWVKDTHYRSWWWHHVAERLDRLGNRISPDDRHRIEAALAAKVRRVTAKQVTAYDLREQRKFRAEHGECPGCYPYWPEGEKVRQVAGNRGAGEAVG